MDVVALSHLRWNFVFQRPQHLLSRCALANRVFFMEEPVYLASTQPRLKASKSDSGVTILVPELPAGTTEEETVLFQQQMLDGFLAANNVSSPVLWYYTPLAVYFTGEIPAAAVVYDCMDELTAFRGAPVGMRAAERRLFQKADLVFTGGRGLHEAKRNCHPSVHLFPSSIDVQHFAQARQAQPQPADQAIIASPRLGFCGVIDERMDLALLDAVSRMRPEWQFLMLGPIVKVDPADLPRRENLHYLGPKPYLDLPKYLSGWDLAMLPFARNESTRFISPTKTPEYLAAGLPTVSTAIADVVRPYGELGLVNIATEPEEFVNSCERLMHETGKQREQRQLRVDHLLSQGSWDQTWSQMWSLVEAVVAEHDQFVGSSAAD